MSLTVFVGVFLPLSSALADSHLRDYSDGRGNTFDVALRDNMQIRDRGLNFDKTDKRGNGITSTKWHIKYLLKSVHVNGTQRCAIYDGGSQCEHFAWHGDGIDLLASCW